MDPQPQPDIPRSTRVLLWIAGRLPNVDLKFEPQSKTLQGEFNGPKAEAKRKSSPAPDKISFAWRDAWSHTTPTMVALAVLMLAAVIAGINLLRVIPFLRISVLSLVGSLWNLLIHFDFNAAGFIPKNNHSTNHSSSLFWALFWTCIIGIFGRGFIRSIPRYAMWEEQGYRQGCESWSNSKRRNKCVRFGFAHLINIWYSIASCVVLSIGGGIFMWQYLHEYRGSQDQVRATKSAAALHAIYNGIAVCLIGPFLLYSLWSPFLN